MSHIRYDPCTAEIINIDEESFVIDQRLDIIASNAKKASGPWIADWGGCQGIRGHGLNATNRDEAIEKMTHHIKTKKALRSAMEAIRRRCDVEVIHRNTMEIRRGLDGVSGDQTKKPGE